MRSAEATQAFTAFVTAHRSGLARTACLLTGNPATAEDLVQEALIRAWRHWESVQPGREFAWLRRVMANLATDWWRRRRFEVGVPPPEVADVDRHAEVDDRDDIVRLLTKLSPRERAVVVLRHHHDLSEKEVAAELGLPLGTVKSTASRALAKLRATHEPVRSHP